MTAATALFAQRGYEHTSIEAVLEQTGASRGALYHHFASKQALFEAVVDGVEAQVGEAVVVAGSEAGDVDPVARLRAAGCVFAEEEARLLISAARTPADLVDLTQRRVIANGTLPAVLLRTDRVEDQLRQVIEEVGLAVPDLDENGLTRSTVPALKKRAIGGAVRHS